jgi:hypothetical protein
VLTLGLLLDAFVRENAFQLLACLALGVLNASQLIVYLVRIRQHHSMCTLLVS